MPRMPPAGRHSVHRVTRTQRQGFTLVELLLSIAIISMLSYIAMIAVNPQKQLSVARNAKRHSDTLSLVNAVNQYIIDTGAPPAAFTTLRQNICKPGVVCGGVDISAIVPNYLGDLPVDPLASGDETGYAIRKDWQNRTVVEAPLAEEGVTILASN